MTASLILNISYRHSCCLTCRESFCRSLGSRVMGILPMFGPTQSTQIEDLPTGDRTFVRPFHFCNAGTWSKGASHRFTLTIPLQNPLAAGPQAARDGVALM